MGNGRIPRLTAPAKTDLVLVKANPFSGFPTTEGAPVEDFFANIPSPIVMTGDGRVINHVRVGAGSWKGGVAAPTAGFIGIYPTLEFDASHDDSAHYDIIVPFRMEAGAGIIVIVDWAYEGGADAGTVCWGMEYKSIEPGEALVGGTSTITKISAGTHTSGQLVRTIFTDEIEGCVSHDELGVRLYRDVSEDTLAVDASMVAVHFMFTSDKMGTAV